MDAFLRVKDPLRHGRTSSKASILLWISAPWCISIVQGMAQYMLSQKEGDNHIIQNGACFVADANFVILGSLFSFIIPTIVSILFYALSVHTLNKYNSDQDDLESDGGQMAYSKYMYDDVEESLIDDVSDHDSLLSDAEDHRIENIQLSIVTDTCIQDGNIQDYMEGVAKIDGKDNLEPPGGKDENQDMIPDGTYSNFTDHLLSTDQSVACTLLLRDNIENIADAEDMSVTMQSIETHEYTDLKQEHHVTKLSFLLLALSLVLWTPYTMANIVYGVCDHCVANINIDAMNIFKWMAYSSAAVYPILYLRCSVIFRGAVWKVLKCRCCRKRKLWSIYRNI